MLDDALVFAAGGGGSSGFGGGGGGGGGGGFSGGGGAGGTGAGDPIVVVFIVIGVLIFLAVGALGAWRARRRRAARVRAVELAAAVAADDDAAFDADAVRTDADRLYREVQAAWDARDLARLRGLAGPGPARGVAAPARRLRAQGLAQPRRADRGSRRSSTSAW